MNRNTAQRNMEALMAEHGLTGWTFTWIKTKTTLGLCNYGKRTLSLSTHLVDSQSWDAVRLVAVHEVAHALVGAGHGHDYVWASKCRALGGDGKRCSDLDVAETAWKSTCPSCGKVGGQHRAPLRVKACGSCSRTWDASRILVWSHKGRSVPVTAMPARYQAEAAQMVRRYGACV